MYVSNQR